MLIIVCFGDLWVNKVSVLFCNNRTLKIKKNRFGINGLRKLPPGQSDYNNNVFLFWARLGLLK